MATNFETSQRLEKVLDRIQVHLGEAKKLIEQSGSNSIPAKLVMQSVTLSRSMDLIKENIKAKESPY